jgi:hypothetical protein
MICSGIVIGVAQISAAYSELFLLNIFNLIKLNIKKKHFLKGQFISVITPSKASPTTLAGPLTVPLLIFSSFFLNNK